MTNQNVMLGEYNIINPTLNTILSDAAVHIEASFTDPAVTTSGRYTFYGRYNGFTATDNREPLATSWVVQAENGTSSLLVWRDSKTSEAPHACGANPAFYPLGQEGIDFFGTDSSYTSLPGLLPFYRHPAYVY